MNPLHRRLARLEAAQTKANPRGRVILTIVRKGREEEDEEGASSSEGIVREADDFVIRRVIVAANGGPPHPDVQPSARLA